MIDLFEEQTWGILILLLWYIFCRTPSLRPVPVALEEFVDGLDTGAKEEDDNLELAKGDGVHENQLPEEKHNMYFLILQHTSQVESRKKLITGANHLPFCSAAIISLLG